MNIDAITIATPFYNELDSLPSYFLRIREVHRELLLKGWRVDLLLVDDGSRDGTSEELREFASSFPSTEVVMHPKNLGYGASIKTALSVAETKWVAFVDADTNYDQRLILSLVDHLHSDVDMINVSILAPGGNAGYRWHRHIISFMVSRLYKIFFPRLTSRIYTMTCGFRIYRRSIATAIFPINDGFVATSEIMIRGLQNKLRILEYPAENTTREHGKSKMQFVRTAYDHLKYIFGVIFFEALPPPTISSHLDRIRENR